jgi:hypothetical protein
MTRAWRDAQPSIGRKVAEERPSAAAGAALYRHDVRAELGTRHLWAEQARESSEATRRGRGSDVTTLQAIPSKPWSRIVARAWADEDFQDRLLSEPKVVLREYGIETEGEVCVSVAETPDSERTDDVLQLILPPPPSDLSEEELLPTGVAFCGCGGCFRCGRCGCGCGICGRCGVCGLCG